MHEAGEAGCGPEFVNEFVIMNDDEKRPATTPLATIPDLNYSGLVRAVRPHDDANELRRVKRPDD
eukprot:3808799-Heterocapsa_arctica.AAC.1